MRYVLPRFYVEIRTTNTHKESTQEKHEEFNIMHMANANNIYEKNKMRARLVIYLWLVLCMGKHDYIRKSITHTY